MAEDAAVAEPAHVQPPRTDKKTEGSSFRQEIAAVAEPAHVQPPRTDDIIEESSLRQEDAAVAELAHVQPPRTDKKTEGSSSRQEIAAVAEPAHVQPPRTDKKTEGSSSRQEIAAVAESTHVQPPRTDDKIEESSLRQEDAAVAELACVQPPRTDKKTEGSCSRQEIAAVAEPAHVQPPCTDKKTEGSSSRQEIAAVAESAHVQPPRTDDIIKESADQNQTSTMQSNQPVTDVAVVSEGAQVTQSGGKTFFQIIRQRPFILVINFAASCTGLILGLLGGFILQRKQDEKNNILVIITTGLSSMLGAVLGAWLSDKWGRNLAIMASDLLFSIGWPIIMYSEEAFSATLFGYILYAVAQGISQISSLLLIAETCPYSIRGRMTSVMGILMAFGTFASFFLSKTKKESMPLILGIAGSIPLLQFAFLFYMLDTPSWLVTQKRFKEAKESLCRTYSKEEAEVIFSRLRSFAPKSGKNKWNQSFFSAMKNKKFRGSISRGIFLQILSQATGMIEVSYLDSFLCELIGCPEMVEAAASLLQKLLGAAGNLISVDQMERKRILLYSTAFITLDLICLGLFILCKSQELISPNVLYILVAVFVTAFDIAYSPGMGTLVWIFSVEEYTVQNRCVGLAAAAIARYGGNFTITILFVSFKERLNDWVICFFFAGVSCVGVFIIHFWFDKYDNQPLEEHQELQNAENK